MNERRKTGGYNADRMNIPEAASLHRWPKTHNRGGGESLRAVKEKADCPLRNRIV